MTVQPSPRSQAARKAVRALNRTLPRYCTAELSRHGKVCIYFRQKGITRKIRMRADPNSAEFHQEYARLLQGASPPKDTTAVAGQSESLGTWKWLCREYFRSIPFLKLAVRGQGVRKRVLEATWDETISPSSTLKFGDCPIQKFRSKAVRVLRDRKVFWTTRKDEEGNELGVLSNVEAANCRLKYMRAVFEFAKEEYPELVERNWAKDVSYFSSTGSHHTWTFAELEQYEATHPIGSTARLALALGLYTGQRLGDLARLGRRFETNGGQLLEFVQEKNRQKKPVRAYVPIVPALRRIIDASPTGDLFYIVQPNGTPYATGSLGNLFRQWCDEAGLPDCSAHGLRKACVVRLIMDRCTPHQVMAITGHQTLKEVDRYAREYMRQQAALQVLEDWLQMHADTLARG